MKLKLNSETTALISKMRKLLKWKGDMPNYLNEEPMRDELFSSDQMIQFGKSLAARHVISTKPAKDHLLKRLANNEIVLQEIRKLISDAIKKDYQITPAGEWLIDNFYLIEEHIRIAKTHFPKHYSEDLPQIIMGKSTGITRSYDIALQVISHNDGRIDIENLSNFLEAYQTVTNLKLGELWSIPIMLRLALIENIRRVSARFANDRMERNLANSWAMKMIETAETAPKEIVIALADMARSNPPIKSAFVAELIRQLRGKGPDLALVLNWVEQQLSGSGLTGAEMVNAENQKQAADQVSISNCIGSLRILATIDWRNFVESHSIVEKILLQDNNGIYGNMDFSTRDHYRHVVEHIAKKSALSEEGVAQIAIQLMHEDRATADSDPRTAHVGYYLIGKGVSETKKRVKMHVSGFGKLRPYFKRHALTFYLLSILLISIAIGVAIFLKVFSEATEIWVLVTVSILAIISASQLAISVVNFFTTLLVKPNLLPRMDFSKQIPESASTLIVVPTLLSNIDELESLIESLEVRFLANRKDNLYFGLLTDFTDAAQETCEEDEIILDAAKKGIEALNRKYQRDKNDLFLLFHRPRIWNPKENVWMGHERKRGKLSDLNFLLRENSSEHFSLIVGEPTIFPKIKYVITLDTDTKLPLNTAWKLVASMAHPLNRAWYDERKKRVTKGYGILQPRVTISLPDISSSRYRKMHGNEPGIDPYTRASSDVYQDLFGEGSYIGKGIYDVDIFHKVLEGKFPSNRILSHDLLEGCYIRSGLLSDVQLFEKYPPTYRADMKVRLRWLRGDWQIISWLFPVVPGPQKQRYKNPISGLSRWKIFDNIRRSFVPIAHTLFLLLAWLVLPSVLFWTIAVSLIIVFPIFITTLFDIFRKPKNVLLRYHVKNSYQNLQEITVKTLFTLISLPYEAYANLKGIFRTLWRMIVSKKYLLEWEPSANTSKEYQSSLSAAYATMWIEPFLTVAVFTYLWMYAPEKLYITAPILILWIVTPFITWFTSKPKAKPVSTLSDDQHIFLQKLARKTWNFFEQFVVSTDSWLPPDNYQEQPVEQIAHRTSPTNIGISLLASLSAYDFGYITLGKFIERSTNTLNTMGKMERHNGHFYNWYDTETLHPLYPKYISTVDSGNLAGHLLVLKQGLLATPHQPIFRLKLFEGIRDTLGVLADTLSETNHQVPESLMNDLDAICETEVSSILEIKKQYEDLDIQIRNFLNELIEETNTETIRWKLMLIEDLDEIHQHFLFFKPWILLQNAPSEFKDISTPEISFTWHSLLRKTIELQTNVNGKQNGNNSAIENEWFELMHFALAQSINAIGELIITSKSLADQCDEFADMEWDFLYDKNSHLFTIGYNVHDHRIDPSYYDLLASEVRLCIFVCIAQGKLPEESWFALGRLLTNLEGDSILLSWSGSMFEYLMPLLVMPTFENTLLDETYKAAVDWQIKYGKKTGRPWGISESGYNMINASSNYQYRGPV